MNQKQTGMLLLALLALMGLGAAMYTYSGPDRTRIEYGETCVYMLRYCTYVRDRWVWNAEDSWSCSNESRPWLAYPPVSGSCNAGNEGKYGYQKETVVTEIPVTYPPATISAQPLCSLPGQNGWCRSGAGLQLTGHEPVGGYSIFALGGTRNGEPFSLQAATGTIPTLEGRNDFEYWAYSTFGDTSLKGASALYLDSQPPVFGDVKINGTSGNNDWLKSASLSASASDPSPGSGLGGLDYTLNGGGNWIGLSSPASLPDGIHNLQVRASDLAGNTSHSQADEIKVDSLAPALTISESGTGGANGWYISTAQVSASSDDSGSGLAALEVSHNGAAWAPYAAPISLPDGTHSLSFWAEDMAGWVTQDERQIRVDTQVPTISGQINGTSGTNNWYTSTVTVTALASDHAPASGIETFTYALNGAPVQDYTAPLTLTDGQHSLTLTARDRAGLESLETLTVLVDTVPPALQITSQYPEWVKDSVSLAGSASDGGSGLARVEVTFDNGQTWHALSSAGNWSITRDTNQATSGAQTWHVRAVDKAGLSTIRSLNMLIDNTPPRIDLPESWSLWDTVTFDARDSDSGLANAELVISDPQNRWPKRVYTYQPGHLPLSFQWDRRFGDGTLAPLGDYDVSATATDRMGNTRKVTASIRISLGEVILVPPTATPLGTPLPTATPTATAVVKPVETLIPSPTPTSGSGGMPFGATPNLTHPHLTPDTSPLAPPRATPTESPFTSWLGSLFTPPPAQPTAADEGPSPIDWGAGALAAMAGMSAYYLSKRREEEEAQRRAVQEQVAAKNAALRAKEAQQREQAKIQNYLQGKALLEAQLAQSGLSDAEKKAIRAQAQAEGMAAGLGATAAAVTAQPTRRESELAWLLQADKSESQRLAEYQKTPEYQAREQERLAILNWIKTGENPPPSMMDKTEDERLAMFKDTYAYQSQQASLVAWQAEQERKERSALWAAFRDVEKPPAIPFITGLGDNHPVHPNDISQNQLPNCFFLSSLAAVAHQNPDFIYNNIKSNPDGSYSVTLFGAKNTRNPDNSFTYIVTPDKFHSNDSKMADLGDTHGIQQENWVRVYESAYLNSKGGYKVVEWPVSLEVGNVLYPSNALRTITGNPVTVLSPTDIGIDELAKKFDEGYAIVASTPFKVDPGNPLFDRTKTEFLFASHEYFITAVDMGNNTVDVRNPHGWHDTPGNRYYLQMDYADFQDGFQTITMAPTSHP